MSITTRNGHRTTLLAKKYQADVLRNTGKSIGLRQARKEWEIIAKIMTTLKPLGDKNAVKVLKAVAILSDVELKGGSQ